MAVTYVAAARAAATTVTIPAHVAGDVLLMLAVQTSTTVPSGWTSLASTSTGYGSLIAYRVATGPGTTSGTWSSAGELIVSVWRGAKAPAGGGASASASASATANLPGLSFTGGDATVVHAATNAGKQFTSSPAGTDLTAGGGANAWAVWSTAGPVASPRAATTATLSASAAWVAATVALQASSQDSTVTSTRGTTGTGSSTLTMSVTVTSTRATTGTGSSVLAITDGETHNVTSTRASSGAGVSTLTMWVSVTSTRAGTAGGSSTVTATSLPTPYAPPHRTLDEVLAGSHLLRARVDILSGPAAGASLPVTGGAFTEDALSDVTLAGHLEVAGLPEWDPRQANAAFALHAGTEVALWLGVVDDAGIEHWWPRGVVAPTGHQVTEGRDGLTITVDVADRSHAAKRAGIDRRHVIPRDQSIVSGVTAALTYIAPHLPVSIPDTGLSAGADIILAEPGQDVWAEARTLLASIALDLHVDASGTAVAPLVTSPLSSDAAPSTWTGFATSVDDGALCNVVVVPWEEARPDGAPAEWVPATGQGVAIDATSPTGVQSPLGRIVRVPQGGRVAVHSQMHADLAATAELANALDLSAQASGEVVPDPRRHVRDVVEYGGTRYRITRLDWDLSGSSMRVQLGAMRDLASIFADLTAPPVERRTTEFVTGLNPLRVRRGVGESEVIVEWTDALAGVAVGDAITVLHQGMGRRVGVALLTGKALTEKYAGDQVATVNGRPLDVGGSLTLTASDVGAPSSSHTHDLGLDPDPIFAVPAQLGAAGRYYSVPAAGVYSADASDEDRVRINRLCSIMQDVLDKLAGVTSTGPVS